MDHEPPDEVSAPDVPAPRVCGRSTRSGRPCLQRIPDQRFGVACKQHATEAETELTTARHDAYYQGYRDAQESARAYASFQTEQLRKRIAELEEALQPKRMVDSSGRQIVQVGRHAYAWGGNEPLAVGDAVWLPENWVSRLRGPGPYRGEVTALGTSYTGPISLIVGRA